MSDTHQGNPLTHQSNGGLQSIAPGNGSADRISPTPRGDEDGGDDVNVSSEVTDDQIFPSDPANVECITKRQMDMLHDQMKRYKTINARHAEVKERLLKKAAEDPLYPHRGLFFLGPQHVGEGTLGLNMGVRL
jgi:hypothetical protein